MSFIQTYILVTFSLAIMFLIASVHQKGSVVAQPLNMLEVPSGHQGDPTPRRLWELEYPEQDGPPDSEAEKTLETLIAEYEASQREN